MTKTAASHKDQYLKIASKLPIEENFEIPDGLLMPCGTQILVKRLVAGSFMSRGGIIIPDATGKAKGLHGVVMAIGPQVDLQAYPIKEGVKIEFKPGLEEDTLHGGIEYILLDQYSIKGLVPPGNYKHPKFPTNEEKRRETRINAVKNSHDLSNKQMDFINNSTIKDLPS